MKSLIRKLFYSKIAVDIRNNINFRSTAWNVNNLSNISISDGFLWRTDNNFETKFKYTDILNFFFNIQDSWVEIHFYSKDNKLIKVENKNTLKISNELIINSNYLNGIEDYGTFYIYHFSNKKFNDQTIIANRCYSGYAQNLALPSVVHGNVFARYKNFTNQGKTNIGIINTTLFSNSTYKIQKYFNNFDKSELFFNNPTKKNIKFYLNDKRYDLEFGNSILVDISSKKTITIISNCKLLRPLIFSYKDKFLDVHHA